MEKKKKEKPPAFLFYSSDFLTGTMLMTYEQKGKYITLLCLQHQQGHIRPPDMAGICGRDRRIRKKFKKDENGLYYNERLDQVIADYREFCSKQSERSNKRWRKAEAIQEPGNPAGLPIENGIENSVFTEKGDGENKTGALQAAMEDFMAHREALHRPLSDHAQKLLCAKLDKLGKTDAQKTAILNQSIVNGWSGVFPLQDERVKNNAESLKYIQRDISSKDFSMLYANFRDEE